MITLLRLSRRKRTARPSDLYEKAPDAINRFGRLIQISLALYLLPVLLVVLAVGGVGMVVIGCSRLLIGPMRVSQS